VTGRLDAGPPGRGPLSTGAISLRRRVYLLMGVGVFFPLLIVGAAALFWMQALDERLVSARLSAASAVAAHLEAELNGDLEVLQRLAAAVAALDGPDHEGVQAALREAHHLLRHRDIAFVLDRQRRVVADEPRGSFPEPPGQILPLVDEALKAGRPRLSGIVEGSRGGLVFELVPIRNWSGEVVGVAGGTFRPERRDFDRMLRLLPRGPTGTAELVDADGTVIAATEPLRVGRRTECARRMVQLAAEKRTVAVRCAECHAEFGVEIRPDQHLTFAAVGSGPWGLVLRQPTREALTTQGALPWYVVVALLLAQCALAGVFAWGAARSVTAPVALLTDHAERIAAGDLAWPIPSVGSDEVGRLGASLEKMRGSLGALIASVAEANQELERRVQERTRELAEANVQLREREEARSQLLRKVITAQEDERKRIARELHDETTQDLAVLAMGIDAARDAYRSGKEPRLDEVKALAVRTLEDVHRLILDLRPSVLDDLGLLSAIRWYADRALVTRGVSVRCEFGELPRLSPEMETALFRMCQETLSNVARHAQASAVLIQVGVERGQVVVDVEDDGRGFDESAVADGDGRKHWGLMGIRERAEILGGAATVESEPGQGTHVVVRVPLPRDPATAGGAQDGAAAEVTASPRTSDAPRSGIREGAT
jgi:signal transduction histidine kinase